MNSEKAPEPIPAPNVSPAAASGLDPEVSVGTGSTPEIRDDGSGTRDGTVDDVRPLGLSEDPALDDPDYYEGADPEEESTGTADGTIPDAAAQNTEGTADGTVGGTEVAPSGDGSTDPAPESGDDGSDPQSGS